MSPRGSSPRRSVCPRPPGHACSVKAVVDRLSVRGVVGGVIVVRRGRRDRHPALPRSRRPRDSASGEAPIEDLTGVVGNAATRGGKMDYRVATDSGRTDRRAQRPRTSQTRCERAASGLRAERLAARSRIRMTPPCGARCGGSVVVTGGVTGGGRPRPVGADLQPGPFLMMRR